MFEQGFKMHPNRANIGVKTLGTNGKGGGLPVEELWNKKESSKASLKEGIDHILKKWKREKNL